MRDSIPVLGLYEVCFPKPLSITYIIPSIVKEVSAMLVAKITFLLPGGQGSKILACKSDGKVA